MDIIFLVMVLNSFVPNMNYPYPWIAAFIRPFYMIASIRVIRDYWKRYLIVVKESTPMVLFIVVFILYFSWMGQRLFSGTLEGVQYFSTFGDSCFNMLVLMTTSNYPDVMLPSYQIFRLNCVFFITYLVVGLFLLMSLLLAIFYTNFQNQMVSREDLGDKSEFFYQYFERFDSDDKGYLTQNETYKMFMLIHGLVTFTDQTVNDDEIERGMSTSSVSQLDSSGKKRDISVKDFELIYTTKIKN